MKFQINNPRLLHSAKGLELAAFVISLVACGFLLPWWSLTIPAGLTGIYNFRRRYHSLKIGGLAAMAWMLVAVFHDATTGGRTSVRLASLMGVNFSLVIYAAIGAVAGAAAGLSAMLGSSLREALEILVHSRELRADKRED